MSTFIPTAPVPRRTIVACLLAALGVAALIGLAGRSGLGPAGALDRWVLDTLMVQSASQAPAPDVVVVDIDEVSLASVGQWSWPRYRVASLVEGVAAAKPAVLALDVLFPEPDRTSLVDIRQAFKRDFDLDIGIQGVPEGLQDNDGYLGQAMARSDAIGARYFYFDHQTAPRALRPGFGFDGRLDLMTLEQAPGVMENTPAVAAQTRVSGFVNSRLDADGVLRRLPLLIEHQGVVYPSLALAATMRALGVQSGTVEAGRDGLSLKIGEHRIPIDRSGYALLRFNGPSRVYSSVPAVEVLSGQVRPKDLAGKIVFIGSSAVGLNDVHATAVDAEFSGLKIQSVMAQNILDDAVVRVPVWGGGLALALGLLVAAVFGLLCVSGYRLTVVSLATVMAASALLGSMAMAFQHTGLFLPMGGPLLTLCVVLVGGFALRFVFSQRQALRWRRQLANARQVAIESMAAVAETRDPETGAHIKRTQHYVRAIAEELRRTRQHPALLTEEYIELLFLSAPLHDIGKVGVPDHILLKPGPHTPEEREIMRGHAHFGRKIIYSTARSIEGDNFLRIAGEIAATHHEKWDGTGYPDGLQGEQIPLSGRIMAVADIYDALISRRCYKDPYPHERAKAMMQELRGTTFDPAVLDAFFAIEAQVVAIAERYRDDDAPLPVATKTVEATGARLVPG